MKMPLNVVRGTFQWCWERQNHFGGALLGLGCAFGGDGFAFGGCGGRFKFGNLLGGVVLDVAGDVVAALAGFAGGEGSDNRDDEDDDDESPGDFLKDVGRLTDAERLVAGGEIAGETASLAVLQQDDNRKQDAGDKRDDGKDNK